MALTPKQDRFVREYLIDKNATQAAIRAGYSEASAHSAGPRLLDNVEIAAAISGNAKAVADKLDLSAERVLGAIAAIAFGDIRGMFDNGRLMGPDEWDEATAAAVAGIEFETVSKGEGVVEHIAKVKRVDRLKALDMLARHLSLYNDRLEVSVTDGLADRVQRAKERGIAAAAAAGAENATRRS